MDLDLDRDTGGILSYHCSIIVRRQTLVIDVVVDYRCTILVVEDVVVSVWVTTDNGR